MPQLTAAIEPVSGLRFSSPVSTSASSAAVGTASLDVPLLALTGGGREHRVLRGHPAAAGSLQPSRDRLRHRRGADDPGLALRIERRAVGGPYEPRLDL